MAKAKEITSYMMKKARKLDSFNRLSAKEKEKVKTKAEKPAESQPEATEPVTEKPKAKPKRAKQPVSAK